MKKLIFAIIFLFTIVNIQGQDLDKEKLSKNQIGLNITDLFDGTLQLKYERLLGKHISVGLGVGLKGKEGIISLSGLDTDKIKTSDITYSGFKLIPEVRYYINKTQQYTMDGFYFGAYLKYAYLKSDLDGTYINDDGENFRIAFDATLKVTSVGFMIGYKWAVAKRFSIDFLIAGPGAGNHKYTLKNTEDLPDEFYEDLNEALEEYSLYDLLNGDFEFKDTDTSDSFTIPSFRYGISLNYSF